MALILTIIVLVILAAVSINAAFSTGIIDTAVNGTVNYVVAGKQEQVTFDELDGSLQDILSKINEYDVDGTVPIEPTPETTPTPKPEVPTDWDSTKVDAEWSKEKKVVPVPKGFVASNATGENSVENGFVIYQGTEEVNDSNVAEAQTTRNQFVWVPVNDTSTMFTTHNGKAVGQLYNFNPDTKEITKIAWSDTGYREPDVLTEYDNTSKNFTDAGITDKSGNPITTMAQFKNLLEEDFSEMKASIEKYHGFYCR